MRQLLLAAIAQLAIATAVFAQQVTFHEPPVDPANPTADQPVSARVHIVACTDIPIAVARTGAVIELRYVGVNCPIIPIPTDETVALGPLPAGTYDLRLLEVSDPAHPHLDDEAIFVVGPAACPPPPVDPSTPQLCLRGGRFSVIAGWTYDPGPIHGFGQAVTLSSDSGAFWFFSDSNYELMVKVLDACGYNGHFWFFAAGLTDVGVDVVVRDNVTGAQRLYSNPIGRPFQPITDTAAFACP